MKHLIKSALLGGVALAVVATATPAFAQETTSSIRGTVVNASGETLSGVSVTITHVPSGASKTITTNSSGVFQARGLRVGGPYVVRLADGSEFTARTLEGINLQLAQVAAVRLVATSGDAEIDEITVTGHAMSSSIKTGAASNYSRDDIDAMNSTTRDIKSVLRMDPKVWVDSQNLDALSIAGTNNRFNSLTVDGVRQNDDFGLNSNGYPSQRSPISLDVIEQVSVQTAPFDVSYGGFKGGQINIVTKSGTNEFHGGAFFEFKNNSMVGGSHSAGDGQVVTSTVKDSDFNEKAWGVSLQGPIIKDKLFFSVGYDKMTKTQPNKYTIDDISGVTQDDINRVTAAAAALYGYDTMGFSDVATVEGDEKIFLKLDWNISDAHSMTATYQRSSGNLTKPQNLDTRGSAGTLGHWYDKGETLTTYSGQIFSDWSDQLSTEIKVGYKDIATDQTTIGDPDFGLMEIETDAGGTIYIGPDYYRHANDLDTNLWQVKAEAKYAAGDHLFSLGYELDRNSITNLFVPGSEGSWSFESIADFEAGTPTSIFYNNAVSGDPYDAAAAFSFAVHSLYAQDRWTPTDELSVIYGVRFETYKNSDPVRENANFVARYGQTNSENLDGKSIILPRIGFNYLYDERTVIRGGFGLFSGGAPAVWASNSYSNDGVVVKSNGVLDWPDPDQPWLADCGGCLTAQLATDAYGIPQAVLDAVTAGAGDGDTNSIDPNFKIPSTWKANLAVEHNLDLSSLGMGDDWAVQVEAIYSRVKNAENWYDISRDIIGTAPDGRPIYTYDYDNGRYDVVMTNTTRGSGLVLSLDISKTFDTEIGQFTLDVGHAYQNIKDINPAQSSTADSNLGKVATSARNNFALAHSDHEISHRTMANLNWSKELIGENKTSVNLFWSRRSGRNYSFTYAGYKSDTFGGNDQFTKRQTELLYVPTGVDDPLVTYETTGDDAMSGEDFNAWISEVGLDEFRGQIAPRNSHKSPTVNVLDIRIAQEIEMPFMKGHKVTLRFDMDNFSNFLNNKWGRVRQVGFPYNVRPVKTNIVDGQYVYSDFNDGDGMKTSSFYSLWRAQFGISYKF